MIRIENLYKRFGRNEVLKGIDLQIESPGIYAVLGPNGSGKTTLIKSILGMVIPDKGEIFFKGNDISKSPDYRNDIDYLPQIANFPANLTVKEIFSMIKDLRGGQASDQELMAAFGLSPFMDKRLNTLSGGTKQKVNIVLSLMFNSKLIILDEPTTGLDPVALIRLKELLLQEKAAGKTILITTHIMQFVEEMADEIVFLLEGKIHFRGSVNGLKERTHTSNFEKAIAQTLTHHYA
ncbi:ABC transporter ATP-binding protein [Robertkochia aurantiaca]|uniref:ABC transporter ATP-binding protein n=1 Tax=Robertkochia aurantiaca TaxID=2873700 RepID=UPI001CCBC169|nr:ABC transporter ATP-binding protein [Robertkochia sp. 3YJGBD-33]